jgi:hypothetical protein
MVKPHKSTVDRLIDTFDGFSVETQERVLDSLALVHRLSKRRAGRNGNEAEQPELPLAEKEPNE